MTCEAPNNVLSKFEGALNINNETLSLNNDQILLRGCVLRNTRLCYGLVVFAGLDTKLMKNSGKSVFKRTHTDRLLNVLIIGVSVLINGEKKTFKAQNASHIIYKIYFMVLGLWFQARRLYKLFIEFDFLCF